MRNLLALCLLLLPILMFAQERTVQGTVKGGDNRETLPQVTVVIKGTTTGTVTDLDGNYTLTVPEGVDVIVFSYLGYEEQEVNLSSYTGNPITINISLKTVNVGLNTVVVSASKNPEKVLDAPASVTVIGMDRIQSQAPLTVADNLKTTPGVDILTTGLISNNVNVRGFNNIFSGAVLTIVDYRFAAVPSLRVNALQLIPNNTFDMERIEVVRGPGSALYGPNAANGVLAIFTRSPLDMPTRYETTVAMSVGLAGGNPLFKPEFRHAGKSKNNKFGYKISGSYLQGTDFKYYDPREPQIGDSILFGNVSYGRPFVEDTTIPRTTFDRDFNLQNYSTDVRLDYRLNKNTEFIVNGGFATLNNLELTGLGAGQCRNWRYYYAQARFRYKQLFVQYFVNVSDAGDTYLIPQVGADASPPHQFQLLVDKSKQHVAQVQHVWKPISQLNFIYGIDAIFTLPETEGTINGRFEGDDNIFQGGVYLQGEYQAHEKLKFVAALRGDYHDRINNVFFSPKAAVVFKPNPRNNIRFTYNRAFSSPSTLNLFLDLSNGLIPNGINIRGIGNTDGYSYRYSDIDGRAQFRSSFNFTNGVNTAGWQDVGDRSNNYRYFDEITTVIADGLASSRGLPMQTVTDLVTALTAGIAGPTGTIQNVGHTTVDYVKLASGATIAESAYDISGFSDRKGIDNQITQTYEIGYKGILGDKFFLTADAYITQVKDYVSPLTLASASVLFNPTDLFGVLGGPAPGGQLYDNIENTGAKGLLVALLDNDPSFQDASGAIPSISGEVWDEIAVILMGASRQIPIGSVTPDDEFVGSDVILTYANLGDFTVGGFDLSGTYMPIPNLSITANYSFVNRDRIPLAGAQEGYVGLNAPKHKTAVSVEYAHAKSRLTTRATWRWQDGFPANSAVYVGDVKAANLVDLNVNYKVHGLEGLTLTVDVNNIFNYQFQRFPGTPKIGTILIGKVAYTFTENTFKKKTSTGSEF